MKKYLIIPMVCLFLMNLNLYSKEISSIRVLILSGSNNHEWQQTTPLLKDMLLQSNIFTVAITEKPDTLKESDFEHADVVLSNWNSWPKNDLRWPEQTEKALLEFIENGGGFVTFHASSSAFYFWPEFKQISTAAWVMDTTSHGKPSETTISITDKEHPVTKGLNDFVILDELWLNASTNPNFKVLGVATNEELTENEIKAQPAIMVAGYGKGRIFHTILGHDSIAIQNFGFQDLLTRGVEWAATGKVIHNQDN